jgi:cytochrome c
MMKKIIFGLVGTGLLVSTSMAADGKAIFKQKGCTACHKETVHTVGPSVKHIAEAYKGDVNKMIAYLKGEHPAIVEPKKEKMMARFLKKLHSLSEGDLEALAKYLATGK